LIDGNGTHTWADALVTPLGVHEAEIAADYWESRIKLEKIPFPDVYYTSPLSRCLETARLTFGKLKLPHNKAFVPIVKEYLREGISGHTCDRRRTKTYIKKGWPGYKFEKGFKEKDELYRDFFQEGGDNQDIRNKPMLDEILGAKKDTWISITSHSGEITSILRGKLHPLCYFL
jgi:broad specificity phosphatase PhoE